MKRVFSLLLAVCMLLSMVACTAEQPGTSTTTTPTNSESVSTDPTGTESVPTDPSGTQPAPTDPTVTEPAPTDPTVTEPPATQPPATQPPATQPPATQPPATQPPATEPGEKTDFVSVKGNAAIDKYVDKALVNDMNGNPMMHDGKTHAERVIAADGFNYAPGSKDVILFCAGDWYTYKFTVKEAGTYIFGVCAATDRDTPYVIYVDGKKAGTGIFNEDVDDPQYGTADYETFDNSDLLAVKLTKGEHTVKVAIEEKKNHNVYVKNFWLRAEDYVVDGGGANGYRVIYRGDSSNKPVISGGVQITGWTQNGNIWSAPCDVADTRTLYINDNPAVRARSKWLYRVSAMDSNGLTVNHSNFPQISKPQDLELVFDSEWMHHRYPVSGISYGSNRATLTMDQPYWGKLPSINGYGANYPKEGKGFYLENAIELLDEPGEFYFDKTAKRIYYYPFAEENMKTAQCYVGVTEGLLQITGTDKNNRVNGLSFENIQFKYGAWNEVNKTGLLTNQADNLRETKNPTAMMQMHSQVRVECAKDITFKGCVFACLGSTALSMPNAVSDALIDGNIFKDISGLGISVGHFKHDKNIKSDQDRPTRIDITNNVIRRIGMEFRSSPAINAYYVSHVRIMHNDIADVPYTGISLGWGWGQDIQACTDNLIAYNKIVNVTNPTHDGAHIYTLSPNYNTYINNNWCVGSGDQRGGIYPDEGSAHMNIFYNVIQDMNRYWLFARKDVNIQDINVFLNFSDTATASSKWRSWTKTAMCPTMPSLSARSMRPR